ncbi:MAG: C40 family peptidase [Candidatus Thorarchaeota archaeon]
MKNKKSGLATHWYILIIFFFIGLGTFFYYYTISSTKIPTRFLGEFQFNLIKNFQKAEKALFYIDQSVKYAAYQTIYDLGQKGGYEEPDCGDYYGYAYWINFDEENNIKRCYPEKGDIEKVKESFKSIFNENFNTYLIKYPDVKIQKNNYDLSLKKEDIKLEIIGKAITKLVFNIVKEEEDFSGKAEESLEITIPEKLESCILDGIYDEEKGKKIVEVAKNYESEYIDLPYVWGGENKEEGGFDCSGFVYGVFKDSDICGFNYRLTARDYERSYGKEIPYEELEPGDLIFIDNDKNDVVDHVAIYAGENKIIHSSSKNDGIKEEKIPEKYKEKIYSVKRYALKQEAIT